jgi:hypothetical protein
MFAKLFNSDMFAAWTKKEIAELFFSIILIFVLLVYITPPNFDPDPNKSINGLIKTKQKEVNITIFKSIFFGAAKALTKNVYYYSIVSTYNSNYNLGLNLGELAGMLNINIPFTVGYNRISSIYPGYGSNFLLNQLYFGIDSAFNILFFLLATKEVYDYLVFCIYMFLFPLAIFLRIFPFSRKAGGYLLGFCLAILFVFPFAFNIGFSLSNAIYSKANSDQSFSSIAIPLNAKTPENDVEKILVFKNFEQPNNLLSDALLFTLDIFYIATPSAIAQGLASLISLISGGFIPAGSATFQASLFPLGTPLAGILEIILKLLAKAIPPLIGISLSKIPYSVDDIINNYYTPTVDIILPFMVFYILLTLFLLIFSIAFTIILGRSFAHYLGQEGQLYSLSRLI